MSSNPALEAQQMSSRDADRIETLIVPKVHDLGGFEVRRALPSSQRKMIGPFVFFDHFGPAEFAKGHGIDVRPHPHIGLSTVTYLHQGSIYHKDSLGTSAAIQSGDINLMTAGKGITHSERSAEQDRMHGHRISGLQAWLALPEKDEETDPAFENQKAEALPVIEDGGKRVTILLGSLYGERSPVNVHSEVFYADAVLSAGASIPLRPDYEDRGLYVVKGDIEIAGDVFKAGQMMTFRSGDQISITARSDARFMLLGGEPLGKRYVWWNFVASSREKLEAAKQAWLEQDWQNGRFRLPPGDDQEFIPLPAK